VRRSSLVAAAVLLAWVAGAASASTAQRAPTDVSSELRAALALPGATGSRTAALAVDLRSGETVLALDARRPLVPASTEKLAVSFAALRVLGPRYRFRTAVEGDGHLSGRTWQGDLYLVGGGDPTLSSRDLERLASRVAALGVRRVTGRVLGDESLFDRERAAPGWKPSYLGDESPPVSALSVEGARGEGANGSAIGAAHAFAEALARRGIAVAGAPATGAAPPGAVVIAEVASPPLRLVVRLLNRDSDNFAAETLLKSLGTTGGERGTFAGGAAVVRSALVDAGIPVSGVRLVDGSGLSMLDRTTARTLVAILQAALEDPEIREPFVSSLAVAGVSGTLRRRLDRPPVRGRVRAKTGTTSRASALAGYVGKRYAFAVLQNGSPVPYWSARAAQDRFVAVLARS
jgi:D-alanyl-D-alanine carboxypeptidase/D-alanyl-D-alanine-endopeptidase (penicillin-binding protein 4)